MIVNFTRDYSKDFIDIFIPWKHTQIVTFAWSKSIIDVWLYFILIFVLEKITEFVSSNVEWMCIFPYAFNRSHHDWLCFRPRSIETRAQEESLVQVYDFVQSSLEKKSNWKKKTSKENTSCDTYVLYFLANVFLNVKKQSDWWLLIPSFSQT